ncbi:MAG: UDP-N-acetylmuramate dehydrogenase [bacterium]
MKYLESEPLKNHTTFKIGGPAKLFCQPKTIADLQAALAKAKTENLKLLVLGNGSNVLLPDEGWSGLVIKLAEAFSSIKFDGERVIALAGTKVSELAMKTADKGLSGLEFIAGVPGTVGGAVYMNVGAWGESFGDYVESVKCLNNDGAEIVFSNADLNFSYRDSRLQQNDCYVVEITLKLSKSDQVSIRSKMRENMQARALKQPLEYPSAGSVFKNPPDNFAAKLIEEAGCMGLRVGDAQVSEKHANFIVNLGSARAEDVRALIKQVQSRVKVQLEPEIRIVLN